MYNPDEAKKSYLDLLKDRGIESIFKSLLLTVGWYIFNKYTGQSIESPIFLISAYFIFLAYFTWKPKLIRFLRGNLRGEEYRNKKD